MPLLRLMSTCILGSICALQAAAQSPAAPPPAPRPAPPTIATPHTATIRVLPFSATPFLMPTAKPNPAPDQSKSPADLGPVILSATTDSCFSMRSYSFTAQDLQSSSPTPSTYTTCTPAHTLTLKETRATLVK
jgi:hypothetical protein